MIVDETERQRFVQEEDGGMVFAAYRLKDGVHALVHVEADPALRGRGAAGRFMAALVDYARAHGLKLAPYCPYAQDWFKRHAGAGDVLAGS